MSDAHPYDSFGYKLLPGVIEDDAMEMLRSEACRVIEVAQRNVSNFANAPRLHNILSASPGSAAVEGRLSLHVEHVFRYSAAFRSLVHDPRLHRAAEGAAHTSLRFLDDQLYWKPATDGGATYAHRDSDFFGPLHVVTVWIPLDDVDESNGCLWFIRGSHRNSEPCPGLTKRLAPPPGVPAELRPVDFFYEIDWTTAAFEPLPMSAGDLVLIHRHLAHYSPMVSGPLDRYAYVVEYVATSDVDAYRIECQGVFDYDDRWRYMEEMRAGGTSTYGALGNA